MFVGVVCDDNTAPQLIQTGLVSAPAMFTDACATLVILFGSDVLLHIGTDLCDDMHCQLTEL